MAFRARKVLGSFEKRTPGGVQMVLLTHAFTVIDLKETGKWGGGAQNFSYFCGLTQCSLVVCSEIQMVTKQ